MSRCFPFPPPGYEKKIGKTDEGLIESIKKERERSKKERRKDKKREKKENKDKEKKEKKHKSDKKDEKRTQVNQKGVEENEHLEKSSLTEEHGQQVNTQNLYDSSDSTQNSSKRKKLNSPTYSIYNHGSVLRIRLPLQKHKDLELPNSNEGPCSSGRTEVPAPENTFTETAPRSSFFEESNPLEFEAQRYRDLIDDWNSSPLQLDHLDDDNLEWLFEKKHQSGQCEAKRKVTECSSDGSYRSCSLVPHACYLPEADIYALPFTVPF